MEIGLPRSKSSGYWVARSSRATTSLRIECQRQNTNRVSLRRYPAFGHQARKQAEL
jgi:hypothetical protein